MYLGTDGGKVRLPSMTEPGHPGGRRRTKKLPAVDSGGTTYRPSCCPVVSERSPYPVRAAEVQYKDDSDEEKEEGRLDGREGEERMARRPEETDLGAVMRLMIERDEKCGERDEERRREREEAEGRRIREETEWRREEEERRLARREVEEKVKGARTPPTQFFVDGCYARLLLLYTYRGFSTTTQGQSTCRRSRSLILERIWRKYRGLVIKLWGTFLERCGKLELRNLVHY